MSRPSKYKIKSPQRILLQRLSRVFLYEFEDKLGIESINTFCIQLLFVLYASANNIFGNEIVETLKNFKDDISALKEKLEILFKQLGTKDKSSHKTLPYINSGLFASVEIPNFSSTFIVKLLNLYESFNLLSPADFSAFFESILSNKKKQKVGTFFTGADYVHKVIDPLFLNDLTDELETIISNKDFDSISDYLDKLSQIYILDPACGSGVRL